MDYCLKHFILLKQQYSKAEGKVEIKDFLWEFMKGVAPFTEAEKTQLGPTCELQDLHLPDGVDGTEETGNSGTSTLPDRNSNSWILAKEFTKAEREGINRLALSPTV